MYRGKYNESQPVFKSPVLAPLLADSLGASQTKVKSRWKHLHSRKTSGPVMAHVHEVFMLVKASYCSINDFRLSCRIVSLTAWKTNLIFSVSMAVVK